MTDAKPQIPARDMAKAIAPAIELIGWQRGSKLSDWNRGRYPLGVVGYKASMGLQVFPRPNDTQYHFKLPSKSPEPGHGNMLIEIKNPVVLGVTGVTFSKERQVGKAKLKSSVEVDLDNLEGLTTLSREYTKRFNNAKTEEESIKAGMSSTVTAKGAYGPVEVEASVTVSTELAKSRGSASGEEESDTIKVEAVRHTHMQGIFSWEEVEIEKTVTGYMRLDAFMRIGRGSLYPWKGGDYGWDWARRKKGVDYDSFMDMVAIVEGRGNPRHAEYKWYFDTRHRPPKELVDKIRDGPGIKLTYTVRYPQRTRLKGRVIKKDDVRTDAEKEADIGR